MIKILPLIIFFTLNLSAIEIKGDTKYQETVSYALALLEKRAPTEYTLIKKHIGVIVQSKRSGMRAWLIPPRYEMSNVTAYYSPTWCAGTIAHDAYHSYLYDKYRVSGKRTAKDKWAGFEAERLAIDFQYKVMKKIGASQHELTYLSSLDGTHGDTNKDGKLDKTDYQQRDW